MPLSFPLAGPLGAGDVSGDTADGSTLEGVDHQQSALDRMIEQFKDKTAFRALIAALAAPADDLDLTMQQLSTLPSIDYSVGIQLDRLGVLVGEPRNGNDDGSYRLHLKARIWANRGSGTPEDVYGIFALLVPGDTLRVEDEPPAAFTLHIETAAVDPTFVVYYLQFLGRIKPAGVRATLHWFNDTPANSFCFAGGAGLGFDGGIWTSAEEST